MDVETRFVPRLLVFFGIVRVIVYPLLFATGAVLGTGTVAAAQTQLEMNQAAGERLRAAEADLKGVIGALEAGAKGNAEALGILRKAQAAWESYRDAQLRAMWPFPDRGSYGSVMPMCVAAAKTEMTRARTRELRGMLTPVEGDSCSSQWPH